MIFYFTGTGNSLYAAEYLRVPDETLVNVAVALREERFRYSFAAGERVGFVFPTYCSVLGDVIADFLKRLDIEGDPYLFAVITCGGGMGGAGAYLDKLLGGRLDYLAELVMPDNTVFYWDVPDAEAAAPTLQKAERRLSEIKRAVEAKEKTRVKGSLLIPFYRAMYHRINKTKLFWVTDSCVGCGKCAAECPSGAIEMTDGKPSWTKKSCMKCASCINRCPVRALQYGKGTKKRRRYLHPALRKK